MKNQQTTFEILSYLSTRRALIEIELEKALPVKYPENIYEAMRYSLLSEGKRLRPIFCIATCELFGGSLEIAMPTACAIEMLHTASLIHDDLPAMDNDNYRRGRLANHKVYGEQTAILAGDALLAYAFEYILLQSKMLPAHQLLRVIMLLSHLIGVEGLVGGQFVDLQSEGVEDIDLETVNFIHRHKTAALFEACILSGAILAGVNDEILPKLSRYAHYIGLAFQIIDDVLDITATTQESGKLVNKNKEAQKATYPRLLGIVESKSKAQELITQAKAELNDFGEKAIPLVALTDFLIYNNRSNMKS